MRAAVDVFPGRNCDADAQHVLREVMAIPTDLVWHTQTDLAGYDAVVLPGGFSYGDYLRSGAVAATAPIMAAVARAAARGVPVLGICNGFQVLLESGLLPGAMLHNEGIQFRCRWVHVRVETDATAFTRGCAAGSVLRLPIAHGEGSYHASPRELARLQADGRIVFRYWLPVRRTPGWRSALPKTVGRETSSASMRRARRTRPTHRCSTSQGRPLS
jgi:phosphoribosylformylglycinamidine synthase